MLEKVRKTIRDYNLLVPGDKVVVAVSGGADSVCLIRILSALVEEYRLDRKSVV
jgi:tRNA(Ile)-lysidine synthase